MKCRKGCAACCIYTTITSPLPGMPEGKPRGVPCINLDMNTLMCRIWNTDIYPEFCKKFVAQADCCGNSREEANRLIEEMDKATTP